MEGGGVKRENISGMLVVGWPAGKQATAGWLYVGLERGHTGGGDSERDGNEESRECMRAGR